MNRKCDEHNRTSCHVYACIEEAETARRRANPASAASRETPASGRSNVGVAMRDLGGGPAIGIGNGLTIDPIDGSLGVQIGPGLSLDFDSH